MARSDAVVAARAWLLHASSAEELDLLRPLHHATFATGERLVHADTTPAHFWFIERGFVSVIRTMADGTQAEVGYVSARGTMPVQLVFNEPDGPLGLDFVAQLPTEAWRADAGVVRRAIETNPVIRKRFHASVTTALAMMSVNTACNRLHHIDAHIIRRLLAMTHDSPVVPLTQTRLAETLGIHRTGSVARELKKLADAGLIRRRRGEVEILDRAQLEERTCECHRFIEQRRAELIDL